MDHKFTELIGKWLETAADERDYSVGALYLLKLSGNAIMYRNIIAALDKRKDFIEYQLQKYYNFRVQELTHAQVVEKETQVEEIVVEHIPLAAKANEGPQKGKRSDHDQLPEDIQAKYVENLSLLQRMRELHLRLRTMSTEDMIEPQPFTATDDPRVLGIEPIPNIQEKISAMIQKYRAETIDIEDVQFEEVDLELDTLFSNTEAEQVSDKV
jgi:hypothetical protein